MALRLRKRHGRVVPIMTLFVLATGYLGMSVASAQEQAVAPSTETIAETQPTNTEPNPTSQTPPIKALPPASVNATTLKTAVSGYTYTKHSSPARTEVSDAQGWLATFTNGARTVSVRGNSRSFTEPTTTTLSVTHNVWVRLLPQPFDGVIDESTLPAIIADSSPDVLGIAMQYIEGSGSVTDSTGQVIAGDANYGPLQADGTRKEGADFNDYLGISQQYGTSTDTPESDQLTSLDCSGYIRMVFGYRLGLPLSRDVDVARSSLPRRAVQMYDSRIGASLLTQGAQTVGVLELLRPGDIVFQDASTDDGTAIDHVGIYIGKDSLGNYRFISSRKIANGPTMGDMGGKSILNGTGLYARSFVAAKRL